jgi:5,10-methenyltetrahydrofolate synthetase
MSRKQIVTRGTQLLHVATTSSKDMIASAALQYGGDGAYTTARTVGGSSNVLEFNFQVERLNETAALLSMSDQGTLPHLSRDAVAETIATAFQHFDAHFPEIEGDRRVTLLLPKLQGDEIESPSSHLFCHVEQLPNIATPPIIVELRGKPRDNPLAKNIEWITERKHLEESRQEDVHEVVLSTISTSTSTSTKSKSEEPHSNSVSVASATIVEGTQTNVFVVTKDGTVRTAGEGVLAGTVRKLVMEECVRQNIPLDVTAGGDVTALNDWEEMFLTSTSRLVLPVDEVRVPQDSEVYTAAHHAFDTQAETCISITTNQHADLVRSFTTTMKKKRSVTESIMSGVKNALMADAVDVIGLTKDRLRRTVRNTVRSVKNIDVQSKDVACHVIRLPEYVNARGVGIFLSMASNEVDTGYILSDLFQIDKYDVGVGGEYGRGMSREGGVGRKGGEGDAGEGSLLPRKVYVPYVTDYTGKGTMEMLRVASGWSEICGFERNRWDIPEPTADAALKMENAMLTGCSDLDVLIVPCVAFDRNGRRCGHGGGFYDRFIENLQRKRIGEGKQRATLVGVALGEQLVDHVVAGKHDVVVDYVVVPEGVVRVSM